MRARAVGGSIAKSAALRVFLMLAVLLGAARVRAGEALRRLRTRPIALALLCSVGAAQAHKSSDAYLQIDVGPAGLTARWDIALRDLDAAIALDVDDDGQLTWAEVRSAWPRIEAYALPRLRIDGCPLHVVARSLERRSDGAYAALQLASACAPAAAPAIGYTLLREIDPTHRGIAKLRIAGLPDVLRSLDPNAAEAGDIASGSPGAALGAAPGTASPAPGGFLSDGVHHILTGYDHVLFLICLLLPAVMRRVPARGWQPVDTLGQALLPVAGIVTAFTVAHSITLGLAAAGLVTLPPSFIEPAIAVTIVLAALDNIHPIFPLPRVAVTFFFGLIHGFGFANVLAELKLPPAQFAWALLQFNVGLELGQLAIVFGLTTLLFALRARPGYRPWVVRGGSCAAMALGVLWVLERTMNVALLPF